MKAVKIILVTTLTCFSMSFSAMAAMAVDATSGATVQSSYDATSGATAQSPCMDSASGATVQAPSVDTPSGATGQGSYVTISSTDFNLLQMAQATYRANFNNEITITCLSAGDLNTDGRGALVRYYLYTMNDSRLFLDGDEYCILLSDFKEIVWEIAGHMSSEAQDEYYALYCIVTNDFDLDGHYVRMPRSGGFGGFNNFYFEDPYDVFDGYSYHTMDGNIMVYDEARNEYYRRGQYEVRYAKENNGYRDYYRLEDITVW